MGRRRARSLNCGAYNVYGKNERADEYVQKMIERHDLDLLFLSEIFGARGKEMASIPGYRLIRPPVAGDTGDSHNGLLVRDGVSAEFRRSILLSPWYYFTRRGSKAARIFGATALIDGWLRAMSTHMPPGVQWRPRGSTWARPSGPDNRVEVYRQSARRIKAFCAWGRRLRRNGKRTLAWADWNASWGFEIGRFTPAWIARGVRGLRLFHGSPKGEGHDRIDYGLTDADITDMLRHDPDGSDHPFYTFTAWRR